MENNRFQIDILIFEEKIQQIFISKILLSAGCKGIAVSPV
jgi:hypothetical protein